MTPKFFQQWNKDAGNRSSEMQATWWLRGDYEDLNKAMIETFEEVKDKILRIQQRRRSWMWEMGKELMTEAMK